MAATSNKSIIKGSDLMLFMANTANATVANTAALGYASSCSITLSAEATSVANKDFGNGWDSNIVGNRSWTASSENLYAEDVATGAVTFKTLLEAYLAGKIVTLVWAPTENVNPANENARKNNVTDATNGKWAPYAGSGAAKTLILKGDAIITNITANANNGESANYTVEFAGAGAIGIVA